METRCPRRSFHVLGEWLPFSCRKFGTMPEKWSSSCFQIYHVSETQWLLLISICQKSCDDKVSTYISCLEALSLHLMAIPSSPNTVLSGVNPYNNHPCKENGFNPSSSSSCKRIPSSFNFSYPKPGVGVHPTISLSSSCCSSPVLEDSRTDFDVKVSESSIPSHVLSFREPGDDLGCELLRREEDGSKVGQGKAKLNGLVRYLVKEKKWGSVLALFGELGKRGMFPDGVTCSRLISSCIESRKFKVVDGILEVLGSVEEVAAVAFEAAMRGYNKLHMYRCSVEIHERMMLAGIGLNPVSYYGIMKAYTELGDVEKVIELFSEYKNMRFSTLEYSDKICALVIKAFCRLGKASEAHECLEGMKREKVPTNTSLYASLISCFAGERQISAVEELLEEAESEEKLPRDPAMFLKVVMMYMDRGQLDKAFSTIDRMVHAKVHVPDCILCAIISGFSKKRGYLAAVRAYEDMRERGCQPGQVTYASAINAYCRAGLYSKAEMIFTEMETKGYDRCVVAYSSMMSMYRKLGRINNAMRLLAKMKSRGCKPNVWIYNTLMEMHGKAKDLKKVEKLWSEMKRKKITPDKVSYTTLISAYNRAGEYDKCVEYYSEFRTVGGSIDRVMGGIMVGVLSKSNRFDELIKLLQDMKAEGVEFDGRLFRSAMNALRDAGLGSQAKWLKGSFAIAEFRPVHQAMTMQKVVL